MGKHREERGLHLSDQPHALIEKSPRQTLAVLAVVGIAAFVYGLVRESDHAWHALLLNNVYFLSLALMGAVFIAINYLVRSGWTTVIRRIPEAMTGFLPIGAALMLVLLFGLTRIYHWAEPHAADHDAVLQAKAPYLNVAAMAIRTILFLVLWLALAQALVLFSSRQDSDSDLKWTERSVRVSAVFIVVFALTFTLASIDWIMSLEPHWYSTLFPWYVMSSSFVAALALITLIAILLNAKGQFDELGDAHLHDLGKYVFAFSVFWGYLWFSQYLLIWYSNIPEETVYFRLRSGAWLPLFLLNPVINLAMPFVLLSAKSKRNIPLVVGVCLLLIVGHWLDFFLMVMPSISPEAPHFHWIDFAISLGIASMFVLSIDRALRSRPLIPKGDPYLKESLAHHG